MKGASEIPTQSPSYLWLWPQAPMRASRAFTQGSLRSYRYNVGLLVAQQLWAPAIISNKIIATPGQGLL